MTGSARYCLPAQHQALNFCNITRRLDSGERVRVMVEEGCDVVILDGVDGAGDRSSVQMDGLEVADLIEMLTRALHVATRNGDVPHGLELTGNKAKPVRRAA